YPEFSWIWGLTFVSRTPLPFEQASIFESSERGDSSAEMSFTNVRAYVIIILNKIIPQRFATLL
ncbi:hypothetical protein, partial [Faecalispora jeddahensis]|uniref:hypothetical protein n=1 Tax=Faecalispora jeddahensis TaxID=1414721 RepID=UPI0028AC3638